MYPPEAPKGFYLNRGIFYFGRKVENAMDAAEAVSRKHRKPGAGVNALAQAARLNVLEKMTGSKINRHRNPGSITNSNPFTQHGRPHEGPDKDTSETIMRLD